MLREAQWTPTSPWVSAAYGGATGKSGRFANHSPAVLTLANRPHGSGCKGRSAKQLAAFFDRGQSVSYIRDGGTTAPLLADDSCFSEHEELRPSRSTICRSPAAGWLWRRALPALASLKAPYILKRR